MVETEQVIEELGKKYPYYYFNRPKNVIFARREGDDFFIVRLSGKSTIKFHIIKKWIKDIHEGVFYLEKEDAIELAKKILEVFNEQK